MQYLAVAVFCLAALSSVSAFDFFSNNLSFLENSQSQLPYLRVSSNSTNCTNSITNAFLQYQSTLVAACSPNSTVTPSNSTSDNSTLDNSTLSSSVADLFNQQAFASGICSPVCNYTLNSLRTAIISGCGSSYSFSITNILNATAVITISNVDIDNAVIVEYNQIICLTDTDGLYCLPKTFQSLVQFLASTNSSSSTTNSSAAIEGLCINCNEQIFQAISTLPNNTLSAFQGNSDIALIANLISQCPANTTTPPSPSDGSLIGPISIVNVMIVALFSIFALL